MLLQGLSPYNPQIEAGSVIQLNDCTLREGVQGLGLVLTPELAVRIARLLASIGIRQIQVGMPGRSHEDAEAIGAIRGAGIELTLESVVPVYGERWKEQVDKAAATRVDVLHLIHAASDRRMAPLGLSREAVRTRAITAVEYAVRSGARVVFTPTDTTHVNPEFLSDLVRTLASAGASRIGVADTAGCANPQGMAALIRMVANATSMPIQVHCHNDLGLALANTLAAVDAGASVADVTVLGLGERTGNAALDEVAVALEVLYARPSALSLPKLTELTRAVAQHLGVEVPDRKPIVGSRAFHHNLDLHANDPQSFEPIPPGAVGNRRGFKIEHGHSERSRGGN